MKRLGFLMAIPAAMTALSACSTQVARDEEADGEQRNEEVASSKSALGAVCAVNPDQGAGCPSGYDTNFDSNTGILRCKQVDDQTSPAFCLDIPRPPWLPNWVSWSIEYEEKPEADSCVARGGGFELRGPVGCPPGKNHHGTSGHDVCGERVEHAAYPVGCVGTSPGDGAICAPGAAPVFSSNMLQCVRTFTGGGLIVTDASCRDGEYVEQPGTDACKTTRPNPFPWLPPIVVSVPAECPVGSNFVVDRSGTRDQCVRPRIVKRVFEPPYAR